MSVRVQSHDPRGPTCLLWRQRCWNCGQETLSPARLDRCSHCSRVIRDSQLTEYTANHAMLLRMGKESLKRRRNPVTGRWETNDPDYAFNDRIQRQTIKQMEILQNRGYGKR